MAAPDLEQRTIAKVSRRIIPLLVVCYLSAYLDRVNVGFAKLEMGRAIGLSETAFGLGAGLFFLTYFAFEVPSNLALARLGARRWIARIMLSWGIVSGAMAFLPQISALTGISHINAFYALRLLLGAAEAGFFPGIIFYLSTWFPSAYRGRMIGLFMAANPASSLIGAPISGYLLGLHGLGLVGWQWLFIIEALPAMVLAVVIFFMLTDRPSEAAWLEPAEQNWLTDRLSAEARARREAKHMSVGQALTSPKVLALALVYFGAVACNYGIGFFLPTIVKGFGLTDVRTGWVTAIPYLIGTGWMIWYTNHSDRTMERKGHAAVALLLAAVGFGLAAAMHGPVLRMAMICVGAIGVFGALPVFWTLPTAFLSGTAAAAGIAIINSIGNLAGFVGPFAMGSLKDRTGSFSAGLLVIAGCALMALIVVLIMQHDRKLERAAEMKPTR